MHILWRLLIMKKIHYFILLLCFYTGADALMAQHQIKAVYAFHNTAHNFKISHNYTLFANLEKSSYKLEIGAPQQTQVEETNSTSYRIYRPNNDKRSEFYTNFKNNEVKQVFVKDNKVNIVLDLPPKLDWKILTESKEIGTYTVIKAETSFRGRDYTAWFAPSIPIQAGPWKLFGLPGLIFKVEDTEAHYAWELTSLEEIDVTNDLAITDTNYTELSLKEAIYNHEKQSERESRINAARQDSESLKTLGFQTKTTVTRDITQSRIKAIERKYEWEEK